MVCTVAGAYPETAASPGVLLGVGAGSESFDDATGVDGGTYLTASFAIEPFRRVLLDLRYATNLVPDTFTDHLAMATLELNFARDLASPAVTLIGPSYLADLAEFPATQYVGAFLSLIHARTPSDLGGDEFLPSVSLDALTLRVLWNLDTAEVLVGFALLDVQILF